MSTASGGRSGRWEVRGWEPLLPLPRWDFRVWSRTQFPLGPRWSPDLCPRPPATDRVTPYPATCRFLLRGTLADTSSHEAGQRAVMRALIGFCALKITPHLEGKPSLYHLTQCRMIHSPACFYMDFSRKLIKLIPIDYLGQFLN